MVVSLTARTNNRVEKIPSKSSPLARVPVPEKPTALLARLRANPVDRRVSL
jgi:hypothetical protein